MVLKRSRMLYCFMQSHIVLCLNQHFCHPTASSSTKEHLIQRFDVIPHGIGDTNVRQLQREIRIITCKINDRIKSPQAAFGRHQMRRKHCPDGDWGPFITPGARSQTKCSWALRQWPLKGPSPTASETQPLSHNSPILTK